MTLVQLANFVRIVELKSLSKAAAVIRVAQPALSRQVRALEAEVGSPLLLRHGWGVTPTPAGEAFLLHAQRVLRDADGLVDTVRAFAAAPTGRVSLGVPTSLAQALLPALAANLRARYPQVRPHMVDGFSAALHQRALNGELDLAVLYQDRAMGPLVATPLLRENLVVVSAADADLGDAPGEALLARAHLILPQRPNRLRLIVDESLARQGGARESGAREPVIEVDSLAAILAMVEQGLGITVLPYATVADRVARGLLVAAALESPQLSRTLTLSRPTERQATAATTVVEIEIRSLVKNLAASMRWEPLF